MMVIQHRHKIENLIYAAKLTMFREYNSKKRVCALPVDAESEILAKVRKTS